MPKKTAKAAKRSSKRKTTKKGIGVRDLETKAHVKGGLGNTLIAHELTHVVKQGG